MTEFEKQVARWDGWSELDIQFMDMLDKHPELERVVIKLILDQNPHKKEIAQLCSRKTEAGWKVRPKRVRLVRRERGKHGA